MKTCAQCGAMTHSLRLNGGQMTEVHLWPIPYRKSEQGSLELITEDGERVRGEPCYPQDRHGTAYREHKHREESQHVLQG